MMCWFCSVPGVLARRASARAAGAPVPSIEYCVCVTPTAKDGSSGAGAVVVVVTGAAVVVVVGATVVVVVGAAVVEVVVCSAVAVDVVVDLVAFAALAPTGAAMRPTSVSASVVTTSASRLIRRSAIGAHFCRGEVDSVSDMCLRGYRPNGSFPLAR